VNCLEVGDLASHNTGPLYRRIAGVLRVEIAAGELKAGSQLPTIAALAPEVRHFGAKNSDFSLISEV
jgi:hypothetical protein